MNHRSIAATRGLMSLKAKRPTVKADIQKNRLYFVFGGRLTTKELDELYTDVRFCVADLKPNFDVITDLTGCHLGMLSAVPTLRKIMNYLVTSDLRSVIRVVNRNSIVFKQAMNFADKFQAYKAIYVSNMEEVENFFENATSREGLRFNLHDQNLSYKCGGQEQIGKVIDISSSGCAVKSSASLPAEGEDVTLRIAFKGKGSEPEKFELKANVVRSEEAFFAVTFVELDGVNKEKLMACLLHEFKQ